MCISIQPNRISDHSNMPQLFQAISFNFKDQTHHNRVQHAQFFANIRTYVETRSCNDINEFQAILRLMQNNPFTFKELLPLSGTL